MAADVFISHTTNDRAVAETICRALENRGLGCWIAVRDIGPGENFQVSIVRAIRAAKVMVLIFSGHANAQSDEVGRELALASQYRLTVIPARVEDVVPGEAFEYAFATRQRIDLFEDWERQIERLSRWVSETISHGQTEKTGIGQAPEDAHLLLPLGERRHLINLRRGRTAKYEGQGALRDELRRLREIDLIRMQPGKTVAEISDGRKIDLAHYVELTEMGNRWADWLVSAGRINPAGNRK
jgi:TIR domain